MSISEITYTILICFIGIVFGVAVIWNSQATPLKLENPFIAKVIYSEASPRKCTDYERYLVYSVIYHRMNHKGFDNFSMMEDVTRRSGAFTAVNDPANKNWITDTNTLEGYDLLIWQQCLELSKGKLKPFQKKIVYYHDKSINKPESWDNTWWTALKEKETDNFIFYSVRPANGM